MSETLGLSLPKSWPKYVLGTIMVIHKVGRKKETLELKSLWKGIMWLAAQVCWELSSEEEKWVWKEGQLDLQEKWKVVFKSTELTGLRKSVTW